MVSVLACWEDHFHKPGTICAMVSLEHCGVVSSNSLQRHRALVLSRGVRGEAAEDDDSDGNQRGRDQTYSNVAVDVFHKLSLTGFAGSCQ